MSVEKLIVEFKHYGSDIEAAKGRRTTGLYAREFHLHTGEFLRLLSKIPVELSVEETARQLEAAIEKHREHRWDKVTGDRGKCHDTLMWLYHDAYDFEHGIRKTFGYSVKTPDDVPEDRRDQYRAMLKQYSALYDWIDEEDSKLIFGEPVDDPDKLKQTFGNLVREMAKICPDAMAYTVTSAIVFRDLAYKPEFKDWLRSGDLDYWLNCRAMFSGLDPKTIKDALLDAEIVKGESRKLRAQLEPKFRKAMEALNS